MFADADIYRQFNAVTYIAIVIVLGALLIICVIVMVLQHRRVERFKQQTGQILINNRVKNKIGP